MSYLDKALAAMGEGISSEHQKKEKTPSRRITPSISPFVSPYERNERNEETPIEAGTCLDCRSTHPGPTACDGLPFHLGAVIEDTPAVWRRAIHCPRCCPAHGDGRVDAPATKDCPATDGEEDSL